MSLVVLCSGGSAPGVTSTALGLTLAWPRPVVLIDADRQPTQAVLAGYLGGADPLGVGLSTFALSAREGAADDLRRHCLALAPDGTKEFLAGFASAAAAERFDVLWPTLLHGLADTGADVVVDAGRIGTGLPEALVAAADRIVVVTRTSLRSVAAQRPYVPTLAEQAQLGHARVEVLCVGDQRPYRADEVGDALGLAVAGVVGWDPVRAAVLSDGSPADRRFARSPLARSYVELARRLVAALAAERDLVRQGSR